MLPGYVGTLINHYKDPYQTTSRITIKSLCFRGSPAFYVAQRWRFHVLRPLLRWICELWEVIWKSASTGHFDSTLYCIGYVWSCCWVSVWYFFPMELVAWLLKQSDERVWPWSSHGIGSPDEPNLLPWLPRLCQLFQPSVSCEFLSLWCFYMCIYLKHLDILPNEYPPGNERMSPEKEPFQKERTVFQASFFRAHVRFFFFSGNQLLHQILGWLEFLCQTFAPPFLKVIKPGPFSQSPKER